MDRKVKKNNHYDKPSHQRWLYHLADYGWVKAIAIIWGVCLVIIATALLMIKILLGIHK